MFAEITSTSDAVARIAWTMLTVFAVGMLVAWMRRP